MNASRANAAGAMVLVRGAAWLQRLHGCVGTSVVKTSARLISSVRAAVTSMVKSSVNVAIGKASARTSNLLNTPNTKRLDLHGRGVFVILIICT